MKRNDLKRKKLFTWWKLWKKCSPYGSGGSGVSVGTSSHLDQAVLVAAPANLNVKTKSVKKHSLPDASGQPLHLVLATKGAGVLRVLRDLHILHSLPQGGAVPGFAITSLIFPCISYLVPYFPVIPTFLVRLAILKAASEKERWKINFKCVINRIHTIVCILCQWQIGITTIKIYDDFSVQKLPCSHVYNTVHNHTEVNTCFQGVNEYSNG